MTGATSGVGRALATALAGCGAQVVILARDAERGRRAAAEIGLLSGRPAEVIVGDLADLRSVERAASDFRRRWDRLDVLAHVAGVVAWKRLLSVDGFELTFATNLLGPALLTRRLLDLLERSAPARVVAVSGGLSVLQRARLDMDDLPYQRRRFGALSTAVEVMLARVLYILELARRLEGRGVTANAFYPGLVRSSLDRGLPLLLRLPVRLVQPFLRPTSPTAVRAAAAPDLVGVSGAFLSARRVRSFHNRNLASGGSERLWSMIERLVETTRPG